MKERPRPTPEAAQFNLPLPEPQLDLFGFATARAMSGAKGRSARPEPPVEAAAPDPKLKALDPFLDVFDDPWSAGLFLDGPPYADVKRLLTDWPSWPRKAMALTGPAYSGKTHIARIWAHDIQGRFLNAGELLALEPAEAAELVAGPIVIDDADSDQAALQIFSIFNALNTNPGPAIFVGRTPPALWPAALTDLASRFKSLPSVRVGEPDDAFLRQMIVVLCRKRFIRVSDMLASGLIARSAQSFAAVKALADAIERLEDHDGLEPSPRLIERILDYAARGAPEGGRED